MNNNGVFDLDAIKTDNVEQGPFRFRFGGDEYEMPGTIDLLGTAALTEGKLAQGFARLLGDEQWSRMLASKAVLTADAAKALMDAYAAHLGLGDAGESLASTDS